MGHDLVGPAQGDVLEEDADHTLALTLRSGGLAPESGEVGGEGEDLFALLSVEDEAIGLPPALVVLISGGQRPKLLVPIHLQGVGYQPVVGVDAQLATLGQFGFAVPGASRARPLNTRFNTRCWRSRRTQTAPNAFRQGLAG
jgi:hypothetical protein